MATRERLYGEFIDQAAKAFADALVSTLSDTSDMVHLYATRSKIRLFAPEAVTHAADLGIRRILETYAAPNRTITELQSDSQKDLDFLSEFTECCRKDLVD